MTFTNTHTHTHPDPSAAVGLRIAGMIAFALAALPSSAPAACWMSTTVSETTRGYYHARAVGITSSGYAVSSAGLDIGSLNSTETFVAGRLLDRVR